MTLENRGFRTSDASQAYGYRHMFWLKSRESGTRQRITVGNGVITLDDAEYDLGSYITVELMRYLRHRVSDRYTFYFGR